MTREEAIRELKADYCGNRIICELYPDQCNQEDCEIWLAIKALETQPDGDAISRRDAIRIVDSIDTWQAGWRGDAIESLKALPSAQTEQTKMIKEIRKWINSGNRGSADYFIVDKIEEIINKYE